jgi:hypothetical protein
VWFLGFCGFGGFKSWLSARQCLPKLSLAHDQIQFLCVTRAKFWTSVPRGDILPAAEIILPIATHVTCVACP